MILVENAFESFKILCVTFKKVLRSRICDSPRAPRPEGGHFFPRQDMNIKNDILSLFDNRVLIIVLTYKSIFIID